MDILAQLQALVGLLSELQAKLSQAEQALVEATKKAYDEGFAAGVASVPVGSDKIYSQEELEAKIAEAVEPIQKKVSELQTIVNNMEELTATKVAEAMAAFKVELMEKVKAIDAIEDAAMEELLK